MSRRDVEKAEADEENWGLLGARNEGRPHDKEHQNRADDMELADFEQPGPSSSSIAKSDGEKLHNNMKSFTDNNQTRSSNTLVDMEEPNQFQEPNLSEGIIKTEETKESEESTDELQKPEPDQNFSLIASIYNYKNKELIRWFEQFLVWDACPIPILAAACQAQSNEEALQILLDAGKETRMFGRQGLTSLHVAAFTNEPKSIEKILGFSGLTNEETYAFRKPSIYKLSFGLEAIPLGYTALHVASAHAHIQAVRPLLAAGANPNLRDKSNLTPLDVAGLKSSEDNVQSYMETLKHLRKYGGSVSEVESSNKLVLERTMRMRSPQALSLLLDAGAPFDPRNPSGSSLMHRCVELKLQEHLEVLLTYHSSPEMDYRAVDVTDEEGSTVLHWAASEPWSDGVTVALLARADITIENSKGDTALHLAAKAGNFDIVKQILDYDTNGKCDLLKKNVMRESPFSYAIFSGNADIVKYMCHLNYEMTFRFPFVKVGNLNPLEYVAEKNFHELFRFIKNKNMTSEDETCRIVNILAKQNLPDLFFELKNSLYKKYLEKIIAMGYILHKAIRHNSREMIITLIREGADLSKRNEDGETAISLLMYQVPKPTELMSEVFDGCISSSIDKNVYEKDCEITINYNVLKSLNKYENGDRNDDNDHHLHDDETIKTKAEDMKVLEALIETGDVYDQRSLLTHPVVESFLCLKWKKCAKFIYFLISAYVIFLISLNTFIVTIFYHMDHKIKEQDIRSIFNPIFWRFTAIFTFLFFFLVDIYFWFSSLTKWSHNKTIWLTLLLIVGGLIMICIPMDAADTDVVRGVAVITVSLSWIYLMILLSWTPTLGYYMQMYGKVSRNVIKVMLSFSFPLVGFSICFMILLRSKEPFDDPIAAFLKTMVMMSSEFEYENLVKNKTTDFPKDAKNSTLDSFDDAPLTSVFMLRIVFLLFLICVAIVLMNLMLGVAVSDFQELSHDGKQRRIMKQIECIIALERLFRRKPFSLFKFTETETWKVPPEVKVKPDSKTFGKEIKETILNKAQSLKETKEKMADDVGLKTKICDMYDLTKGKVEDDVGTKNKIDDLTKKQSDLEKELSAIRQSVNTISETVALIKDVSEKRIVDAVDKILERLQMREGPV